MQILFHYTSWMNSESGRLSREARQNDERHSSSHFGFNSIINWEKQMGLLLSARWHMLCTRVSRDLRIRATDAWYALWFMKNNVYQLSCSTLQSEHFGKVSHDQPMFLIHPLPGKNRWTIIFCHVVRGLIVLVSRVRLRILLNRFAFWWSA